MSMLAELKRRNVFRVALLYVAGSWLMLQVGEILFEALELPDWTLKFILAALLLGFPLVIVFSWVYEITPEGIRREKDVERSRSIADQTARKLDLAVIVLVLAVGGLILVDHLLLDPRQETAAQITMDAREDRGDIPAPARSIAVLPFADMSPEADQAYFADGISEELLNLLARIDDLKVAARTSSFKFRGAQSDVGEIARALNVETILEGSVRKAGNRVRITAQLIDAEEGFHLWSDSYDRDLDNIFAVQDEIASAIVDALRLELDLAQETVARTKNVAAYDAYLRARQLSHAPSRTALLEAIDLYQQAIALDPAFAAAYGGIAEAWIWLEDYGGFKSAEAFPKAEQAARRALELNPNLAEAHAAMAFVQDRYYHDVVAAEAHFERTLEINPNHVQAYNLYADTLRAMGRIERMLEVARKATELDPLSVFLRARLAQKLSETQRFEEAAAIIDNILAEDPDNDYALEERGNMRRNQGRWAEAAADYLQVHRSRSGDPYAAAMLAILSLFVDDSEMARRWIAAARDRGPDNRWELLARQLDAWSRGDWSALEKAGALEGGNGGASQQGWALVGQDRPVEARQAFITSLRLSGFKENGRIIQPQVPGLIGLAFLDKREGLTSWRARSEAARAFLLGLKERGAGEYGDIDQDLARLAALDDDPDAALAHLSDAVALGFGHHWFLTQDPFFEAYRDDPRFLDLVQDMRLRAAEQRSRMPPAVRAP